MDRAAFFKSVRSRTSGVFGGSLSTQQVQGTEAILDACQKYRVTDKHHVANILAQVFHETGGYMLPIKETVMPSHKDKTPSDATVIKRLDTAYAKGQLKWVKTPYWRDGWFGRGPIQTTHERNYQKVGKAIGIDLVKDRNRILEPEIGAASAVVGMRDGLYTGKKLADFNFGKELAAVNEPGGQFGPRRIVNGVDGTDRKIAGYHRAFYAALTAAGFDGKAAPAPAPIPTPAPAPAPPVAAAKPTGGTAAAAGGIMALLAAGAAAASGWFSDLFQGWF